jgi:hypothetical protein
MAMKKKKAEKRTNSVTAKKQPDRKATAKYPGPGSSQQILTGISRSVGNLLDRTKAYLGSGKKAEA